ncbi:MAG: HlyC/CorC family transporter [Lachnospiraceae bacterium]|nr:HlyC/CorC family transporter [Lachnospiraceae bacterium]
MESHPYIGIIIIIAFTLIDFFVSLAKAAFKDISETYLEKLADDDEENPTLAAKASEALKFIDEKERLFYNATWLVIGISWICSGVFYARMTIPMLRSSLEKFFGSYFHEAGATTFAIISVVLITILLIYLIILFAHIMPDRLGSKRSEKYFFKTFGLMKLITVFFEPLSALLEGGCRIILKIVGVDSDAEDIVTEDDIMSMVNESHEQGVLEAEEASMISNIIEFDEKQTKDIMTHRTRIVAVDSEMDIERAMRFMAKQSFSRFPLYTDNIDNIVGVIHMKEVVKCFSSGNYKDKKLIDIARKPMFVPDTQNIDDLFREMQTKNVHMAIVIDEYGQTAGIVAMEDILEEIVGNIRDEFDKEEDLIKKCKDGTFICLGEAHLDEITEVTGFEPTDEDLDNYDTLNGLLISILDRIPEDNEHEIVTYEGYSFELLEVKRKMIRRVRMRKLLETKPSEASENNDKDTTEQ